MLAMSYSQESRPALKFAFKVNFEFYGWSLDCVDIEL